MKTIRFGIIILTFLAYFQGVGQDEKRVKILISTDYGDIVAELYNETPKHRDNMVKLIKEGWYNDSPFHRVMDNFMIQGGHNAEGRVDPGYTIPAEFSTEFYHKKGALAAARQPDQYNPMKESSGCQFYIVKGRTFSEADLSRMSQKSGFSYSNEAIEEYTTVGGYPPLDGAYTVFGQVLIGLEVVDKISAVKTGAQDVPVTPIIMQISIVK